MLMRELALSLMSILRDALSFPEQVVTEGYLKARLPQNVAHDVGTVKEVTWIISEGNDKNEFSNGEFGVLVGGEAFFYYKHSSTPASAGINYRVIEKREFGEVIRRPKDPEEE